MPDWEDIFRKEIKKFIFGRAKPEDLSKYLVVVMGVPITSVERELNNRRDVGPAISGDYGGIPVSAVRRSGGTIQLEELMRLIVPEKTKYVIGLGAVGALQPHIKIGDLIVPEQSVRGEGLTGYYYPPEIPAQPDPDLRNKLLEAVHHTGARVHSGTIFTTGSIMHETEELIEEWNEKGYLGVDCEASAFFLLSKYCGLKAALVLYVTDNPYKKEIFSRSPVAALRVKKAEKNAVKAIFNAITEIEQTELNESIS